MDQQLRNLDVPEEFRSLETLIENDDTCVAFIQYILHDDKFTEPEPGSDIYKFAKARARHSVITFLMGLVLANFAGITQNISKYVAELSTHTHTKKGNNHLKAWMITSLYHDKGYYSKHLSNDKLDYKKTFTHYLLTDYYSNQKLFYLNDFAKFHSSFFAHSYEQITSYDQYARGYHTREEDNFERIDHGILGGILVFNDLVRKALKTPNIDTYDQDEAYSSGYDQGYEDGIKYALSQLREGAVDWKIYMDIEDVDDSIHLYLEDFPDVDCCDVRDMIIYHPDFAHYSLEDLLESLIAENNDEPQRNLKYARQWSQMCVIRYYLLFRQNNRFTNRILQIS